MSEPMPVTMSIIVRERASIRKAKGTCMGPMSIQRKSSTVRAPACASKPRKRVSAQTKAPAIMAVASMPALLPESLRRSTAITTAPSRGSPGTSAVSRSVVTISAGSVG